MVTKKRNSIFHAETEERESRLLVSLQIEEHMQCNSDELTMDGEESCFRYYFREITTDVFVAEFKDEERRANGWMKTIHIIAETDGEVIGRGLGRYVDREKMARRPSFFARDMHAACEELSTLTLEVYDRFGRLKELLDHRVRKGTGKWGKELDMGKDGKIFVIEAIIIDPQWRRKGLGGFMITRLINESWEEPQDASFVLVEPRWLLRDVKSGMEDRTTLEQRDIEMGARNVARSFFRKFGFRRIGASSYFGFAKDVEHQTRRLLPDNDFNLADAEPGFDEDPKVFRYVSQSIDVNRTKRRFSANKTKAPISYGSQNSPRC
jgi:GNAT superfamily N-acetyltransferase